jgi:hypothetical protein
MTSSQVLIAVLGQRSNLSVNKLTKVSLIGSLAD